MFLPQDEAKTSPHQSLAEHWALFFVVEQPATIGARPVALSQATGIQVAYLPTLRYAASRTRAAKTEKIIGTSISPSQMPHTLRTIEVPEVQVAELTMLCGLDDNLTKQPTTTSNRIRGLFAQIHPALAYLHHVAMAELLAQYRTPAALRRAGEDRIGAPLRKHTPGHGNAAPRT